MKVLKSNSAERLAHDSKFKLRNVSPILFILPIAAISIVALEGDVIEGLLAASIVLAALYIMTLLISFFFNTRTPGAFHSEVVMIGGDRVSRVLWTRSFKSEKLARYAAAYNAWVLDHFDLIDANFSIYAGVKEDLEIPVIEASDFPENEFFTSRSSS